MSMIGKEEQSIIEANNIFAVNLYSQLAKGGKNIFISPFSLLTALYMAYAGAKEDTAAQMERALHIAIPRDEFHRIFNSFSPLLSATRDYELALANALSVKSEGQILKSYRNLIKSVYGGEILKFSSDVINKWVSKKTHRHVREIVNDAALANAGLMLLNAIYFRGIWENQFKKGKTRESDFFLTSGETVRIPLMNQKASFRYAKKPAIQILEMEYKGYKRSGTTERVSMMVFLPSERDGLPKLEEEFTAEFIQQSIASLQKLEVEVFFPRFSLDTKCKLNKAIEDMGIVAAFADNADFSGMTDDPRGLKIESIIHRATIDVDEKGTVAVAATMVGMLLGPPPSLPVFRADHPFIFLLRDVNTGIILFIGKLEIPSGIV